MFSFQKGHDLMISAQSRSDVHATSDWYHIRRRPQLELQPKVDKIATTLGKCMAIAVSHKYNAVAVVRTRSDTRGETKGYLEYKQVCYNPLPLVRLNDDIIPLECELVSPVKLSFSDNGTRLVLINAAVFHYVYYR
jgi:hypothetical protein